MDGWMDVPRRPHLFVNEYYSICCAKIQMMYQIELVEGKDKPPKKTKREFHGRKSPTTSLLIRLCKTIFSHGGMIVTSDSSFCVLKSLLKLNEHGVHAIATIKKRRYWSWGVNGDKLSFSHLLLEHQT